MRGGEIAVSREAECYFLERIGEYVERRMKDECSGWSYAREDATRWRLARDVADELIALLETKRAGIAPAPVADSDNEV